MIVYFESFISNTNSSLIRLEATIAHIYHNNWDGVGGILGGWGLWGGVGAKVNEDPQSTEDDCDTNIAEPPEFHDLFI